jgi:hypothetical protein
MPNRIDDCHRAVLRPRRRVNLDGQRVLDLVANCTPTFRWLDERWSAVFADRWRLE